MMLWMAVSSPLVWFAPDNWVEQTVRLGLAVVLGGAIGWNRQVNGKAGGFRTHMLVSLGAALFVLVPLQVSGSADSLSRSIQGIATGVGFLGAGEIVHYSMSAGKLKVRGLTSAAAIWVTAAIGVLAGAGLWQSGVIATVMTLFILVLARYLERYLRTEEDHSQS